MKHVVLLGDSIFDNKSYIMPGEDDVPNQLKSILCQNERVTHLAYDGSIIKDINNQLSRIPKDATHLVVSVGGNDALSHLDLFRKKVKTVGDALILIRDAGIAFKSNYSLMVENVLKMNLKTTFCSIYYPRFAECQL